VSDSWGQSVNNDGIYCTVAENCVGSSTAASSSVNGIFAYSAQNCYGASAGNGIQANTVANSYGTSSGGVGYGLLANGNALNCYGYNSSSGTALRATVANGCYGYAAGSGTGISTNNMAINCYGSSAAGGRGVNSLGAAIGCFGYSNFNGSAGDSVNAGTAIYCVGDNAAAASGGRAVVGNVLNGCTAFQGSIVFTVKYNMP
jgi:hypothetical protein